MHREHSMRVLIVDDEPGLAETVGSGLEENYGCRWTAAVSAAEALALCQENDYDVVVADYVMPETSGLELARQLRRCRPNLPVVLLTAYGSSFYSREEREPEIDAVVQKPMPASQFIAVLRRVVQRRHPPAV
jgi:CheY-like chemotaxis protein